MQAEIARLSAEVAELKAEKAAREAAPAPPALRPLPPPRRRRRHPPPRRRSPGRARPNGPREGGLSFKPRGRLQLDTAAIDAPDGVAGDKLGVGTEIRRAFLGIEGTLPGDFGYRIEADLANSSVELTDVFLTYKPTDELTLTVGQHKPFGGPRGADQRPVHLDARAGGVHLGLRVRAPRRLQRDLRRQGPARAARRVHRQRRRSQRRQQQQLQPRWPGGVQPRSRRRAAAPRRLGALPRPQRRLDDGALSRAAVLPHHRLAAGRHRRHSPPPASATSAPSSPISTGRSTRPPKAT